MITQQTTRELEDGSRRHEQFIQMLPRIRRYARLALASAPPSLREDLIEETVALAWTMFRRLAELGKQSMAYPTPLTRYALRRVRTGRRFTPQSPRDVLDDHARRRRAVRVQSLDAGDRDSAWKEWLLTDRRATPADLAAMRLDFTAWLATLSTRQRRIALGLARGESTNEVAQRFQLSAGRVSQIRRVLHQQWRRFQGELPDTEA